MQVLRLALLMAVGTACGTAGLDPAGPTNGTPDPVDPPDVSGVWVVTQSDDGTFEERDGSGTPLARATGDCSVRKSGGGPWTVTIVQDGANASAEVPARQLYCEGEDVAPDTPQEGTLRLSETLEGFTVPIRFSSSGEASFVPHNACADDAFSRDIVTRCSWSESITFDRVDGGDLRGTFTVRFDYTIQATRRIYEVLRGVWIAEYIGPGS